MLFRSVGRGTPAGFPPGIIPFTHKEVYEVFGEVNNGRGSSGIEMLWVPVYRSVLRLCIIMAKAYLPSFLAREICSISALDVVFSDTLTGFLPNEAPMVS